MNARQLILDIQHKLIVDLFAATEQRDLMPAHDDEWALIAGVEPRAKRILPWSPWSARTIFLKRYRELVAPMLPAAPVVEGGAA